MWLRGLLLPLLALCLQGAAAQSNVFKVSACLPGICLFAHTHAHAHASILCVHARPTRLLMELLLHCSLDEGFLLAN